MNIASQLSALQIAVARYLGIATPEAERQARTSGGRRKAKGPAGGSDGGPQRKAVAAAAASRVEADGIDEAEDHDDPLYEPSEDMLPRQAKTASVATPLCAKAFQTHC